MSEFRTRVFRDPIHGDIVAGGLQSAVVDTTVFQRLRFIRQNGLLHLVFPGAVHTRFAHSLGTMHLAQRVFSVLFPGYSPRRAEDAHYYIGTAFETAALLHDLGHCAFSHSIERINLGKEPFFHPLEVLVEEWSKKDAPELRKWWDSRTKSGEYRPPMRTEHEDLGLLMIGVLFGGYYENVYAACKSLFGVEPEIFADDVRAMLVSNQELQPSERFLTDAETITRSIPGISELDGKKRAEDLLTALHTLISGTLDVDRLDYLVRDSHYAGVPYGICDVEVLINSLCLGVADVPDPTLVLALRSRGTHALDDLLWSRYQLFSQVLNHKTNVILNALLADAIPEAIESASMTLKRPKAFIDFVELTDDYVMSSVIRVCLRTEQRDKAYDRALVRRTLPLYLGKIDLPGEEVQDKERIIEDQRVRFANEVLGSGDRTQDIRTWSVESALIKGGGMPHVSFFEKGSRQYRLEAPGTPGTYQILEWTKDRKLPAKIESCHFFVDRDCIGK
jgi:HD superfamily phosphohydrolase